MNRSDESAFRLIRCNAMVFLSTGGPIMTEIINARPRERENEFMISVKLMTIVVLGWGSLYWAPRELRIRDGWQADGPHLPVEFVRVSSDGRLTLVLFEEAEAVQVPLFSILPLLCMWFAILVGYYLLFLFTVPS